MRKKMNSMLVILTTAIILVTMTCTLLVFYNNYQRQIRHDLQLGAGILKNTGIWDPADLNAGTIQSEDMDLELEALQNLGELRITWVAADGQVLYDNSTDASAMENHGERPEIRDAMENGDGYIVRQSDTMNKSTYYYALLLENGSVLRVAMETSSIWHIFLTAIPWIIGILILAILMAGMISHIMTRKFMEPIEAVTREIQESSEKADGNTGMIPLGQLPVRMHAVESEYSELQPFFETIRLQHENILSAARSRQDFTANVTHELKTPLTAISGYAELIENRMVTQEQEIHFAGEIRKNAQRLVSLINDIIRLSELDGDRKDLSFELIDLNELVKGFVDDLTVNAQKNQVHLSYSGQKAMARVNADMIRELVDNLVQNAIRYNNPGGFVWISVGYKKAQAFICIKDNGIGIPKDQQERVFERFYRVDKSRSKETGGTGLGLAIVKHIVELHSATIYMDSEPGRGTEIRVEF